jgi:hypothetical protein
VIVLCNAETAEAGTIARKVADVALAGTLGPAAAPSPEPSPSPADERPQARVPGPAERADVAGRYRSEELDTEVQVVAKDDGLVLRIRDRDSRLGAVKDDQFTADEPLPLTVAFTRDAAGKVAGLTLTCGCDGFRTLRLVRAP